MLRIPQPGNAPRKISSPEELRIPETPETGRFCPNSLTDWLEICREAGVPHVPAQRVATLNRADWLLFDTGGPHQERLKGAYEAVNDAMLPGHMLRWDFCAPGEVKYRLGTGQPGFHQDMTTHFTLDDPRAYDILSEHPREEIPVYQRPWVRAQVIEDYPVEYRAFVRDGELLGISNYYPQRPLPPPEPRRIEEVESLTRRLASRLPTPFLWNLHPGREEFFREYSEDGVHFTADFIHALPDRIHPEGEILFLEGGPPHELGAHMCCFRPGEIHGLMLSDRNKTDWGRRHGKA